MLFLEVLALGLGLYWLWLEHRGNGDDADELCLVAVDDEDDGHIAGLRAELDEEERLADLVLADAETEGQP